MTTKAKTKRVRVRKAWAYSFDAPQRKVHEFSHTELPWPCAPCLLVTNPPASLTPSRVKRLLEIAALDFDALFLQFVGLGLSYDQAMSATNMALGLAGRRVSKAKP
jgi:hypothetical protein